MRSVLHLSELCGDDCDKSKENYKFFLSLLFDWISGTKKDNQRNNDENDNEDHRQLRQIQILKVFYRVPLVP